MCCSTFAYVDLSVVLCIGVVCVYLFTSRIFQNLYETLAHAFLNYIHITMFFWIHILTSKIAFNSGSALSLFFPASFTISTVLFLLLSFQWLMPCSRLRRKISIEKKCMATVFQVHSLTSLSHLTCNTIPITCGVCASVYFYPRQL